MSQNNTHSRRSGFTLVEMLVIAPVALLVITGFIALMVTMVGDAIASRSRNVMTYDIQSALNTIERDVRLSTEFLTTSGNLPAPQGKNGADAAFTNASGDLILGEIATDKNPLDPTRSLVHYNTPFNCDDPTQSYKNRIFFITVVYTVRDGSLWRRTYVPEASTSELCDLPWQVNTCAPGYSSSDTQCQANDSEILKNVKNFTVEYFNDPEDTAPLSPSSAPNASTIGVTLESEQVSAGRTITASSTGRSTKLSAQEINKPIPASPNVTASVSSEGVVFSWPVVPTASSYIVEYNINGGGWITATDSSTSTTFTVPASRGETVSARVYARNTTGTSEDAPSANTSETIPLWNDCGLQNDWTHYGGSHATCGFTKTKDGVVMLKGLIMVPGSTSSATQSEVLFTLPPGYRPQGGSLIFNASTWNSTYTSGTRARIDIHTNGTVRVIYGNERWLSLSDIRFVPDGSLYSWSNASFQNSWTNYGGHFAPFQYTRDASDRVHLQGLVKPTASTASPTLITLPSEYRPSQHTNHPDYWPYIKRIYTDGRIIAPSYNTSGYYSMQAMYYPASSASWINLPFSNGWSDYGGGHTTAQVTRASDCVVTVKGLIKNTTAPNGVVVGVLPVGYRPSETLIFGGVNAGDTYHRITVEANGNIRVEYANPSWVSLNGVHFMASGGSAECPA